MTEIGGVAGATGYERVTYEDRPGLVGLLSKNFFLTLITIGIYRFWAATRLRRYLWSNIRIGGDGLEYTGTGRELFLGFLVGLAVLAPLSIVYIVADRLSLGSPVLAACIQGVYFIALFVFLQVALFRSRRYRLSRTTWRGIYAGQTGSTWTYLGLYLGYGVLTLVTVGLALPWMHVALARYKLDNTTFGNRTMQIEAKGSALFGRWLVVIVLLVVPLAAGDPAKSLGAAASRLYPAAEGTADAANAASPCLPLSSLSPCWRAASRSSGIASKRFATSPRASRSDAMRLGSAARGINGRGPGVALRSWHDRTPDRRWHRSSRFFSAIAAPIVRGMIAGKIRDAGNGQS